jgi:outer membrane cobalamin receptor
MKLEAQIMNSYRRSLRLWLCLFFLGGAALKSPGQDSTKIADPTPADSCKQEATLPPTLFGLSADTSSFHGSAYGSFGDIMAELADVYYFNLGSVGQHAIGSLFGGTPNNLVVIYEGLVINDLLTGQADLNIIPEERVGRIDVVCSPQQRNYDYLSLGHAVEVTSRNMASLPIKSRVTYRTGNNGYDDVDARLGIQATPDLAINAGGLLKNYGGTTFQSQYGAQKANIKIERRFSKGWQSGYVFLLNKLNLDIPLPAPALVEGLSLPHQKDIRYDHGFSLQHCSGFSAFMQYTDAHRELYGYRHTAVDQIHDANRLFLTTQLRRTVRSIQMSAGANWKSTKLKSNDWGGHQQWQLSAWTNMSGKISERFAWHGGIQVEKAKDFGVFAKPELCLSYSLKEATKVFFWANRSIVLPSFEGLYSVGPFALGQASLKKESCDMAGIGAEKIDGHFRFYASASIQSVRNEIAIAESDSAEGKQLYFSNRPHQIRLGINLHIEYAPSELVRLVAKAGQKAFAGEQAGLSLCNTPKSFAIGYGQISHRFFQGDLDIRLRLGASFYGKRYGSDLVYSQYSSSTISLNPVIVPYLHGICVIKDVTLFVAMQNPLGQEYEIVYGYPMSKAQLRWGFSWNFID